MKSLIENIMIITMDSTHRIIDKGYILIQNDKILDVQEGVYEGNKQKKEVVDGKGQIVIPGLVNAHTHSFGNLVKGTTENLPLELWLLYSFVEGKYMGAEDYAVNAALGSIEMLKSGTTTFLDHLHGDLEKITMAAEQYKLTGSRAVITPLFSDLSYAESLPEKNLLKEIGVQSQGFSSKSTQSPDIIEKIEEIIKKISQPELGIEVAVGPNRCSDELMIASMELAQKYNTPWHTHLLETKASEVAENNLYGSSMIERFHDLGILNEKMSFAHGVWISEKDIQLIHDYGSSIVHNPGSNLYLGSGIMPLISLKEKGINVALGSDIVSGAGSQSLFESMKLASVLSNTTTDDYEKWISAVDILEMATMGGAKALGMDHLIGSIEKNKKADLVLLNKNTINFTPLNNVIWQLVYGRADLVIESVYVNGRKVVNQQRTTQVDEKKVYEEAISRSQILNQKVESEHKKIQKEFPALNKMLMRVATMPTKK